MTNRRFFIGPIPEGWLSHHRKSWYKTGIRFKNYSSKTVSFSADPVVVRYEDDTPDHDPSSSGPEQEDAQYNTTEGEERQGEEDDEPNGQGQSRRSEEVDTTSRRIGKSMATPTTETGASSTPRTMDFRNISANNTQDAASSYVTAREIGGSIEDLDANTGADARMDRQETEEIPPEQPVKKPSSQVLRVPSTGETDQSSPMASASESESTTALLRPKSRSKDKGIQPRPTQPTLEQQEPQSEGTDLEEGIPGGKGMRGQGRIVKYSLDDNILDKQQRLLARLSRTHDSISANRPRRRKLQKGEIIKAERMLVRVEQTMQRDLPDDYTENDSMRMETQVVDKWREFLVVCRMAAEDYAPFTLQMYKTRVVPEIQKPDTKISPYYEVTLDNKRTRANFYSSLDKTIVLWRPSKHGTKIYIVRPKSTAHSVEWYTFICQALGRDRPSSLQITVPDLGVSLLFKDPFARIEAAIDSKNKNGQNGKSQKHAAEQYVARAMICGCMEMLENRTEWADVLREWSKSEKIGLAWRRYDRLEWVLGVNEEKMYGSIGMQDTHELELRPRQHYSTAVKHEGVKKDEPPPLEGFLVRLTSQRGVHQRLNKMFFKRLYFFTQDHYLFFCRPAKSLPPPPPRLTSADVSNIPSSRQILNEAPICYDIDPFPLQNGDIKWALSGNKEYLKRHDEEAYAQLHRNLHNICHSDGYIDLCRVQEVRAVQRNSSPADPNIERGPDVEYNPDVQDTHQDDGATEQFDDDRTFEMLLDNELVIRLQAYNKDTRDEWIGRMDALVKYWKARTAADATELKAVRQKNLEVLDIDEGVESHIGQFAQKWEVKKAVASPHLHNICLLSNCRTIKVCTSYNNTVSILINLEMSGQLYRKPRRHATFKRCNVILTGGKLLIFRSSLRSRNGVEIAHIHQELETSIDLSDCYIYSGLLTDDDLLYANQTFDNSNPGHHSLPRAYLSPDVFTTCDNDTAITFVIWQPLRKNYFRVKEYGKRGRTKQTLKHVSTLGVHGRTIVFRTKSRVEKDRWVLSIASEIDRIQEEEHENIRIVSSN